MRGPRLGIPSALVVGVIVVWSGVSLLEGRALAAQQEAASIAGRITDQTGGSLPGVTVTATSPSLQLPQLVVVTDSQGDYRLSPLQIGVYEIVDTLTGFQTVKRQEIRVSAGFSTRVDVRMSIGAVEEAITVTGASPVVDAIPRNRHVVYGRDARADPDQPERYSGSSRAGAGRAWISRRRRQQHECNREL